MASHMYVDDSSPSHRAGMTSEGQTGMGLQTGEGEPSNSYRIGKQMHSGKMMWRQATEGGQHRKAQSQLPMPTPLWEQGMTEESKAFWASSTPGIDNSRFS